MNKFKELKVWQRAVDLATLLYENTKYFPEEEKFGLISQIRRSSISISSNIAEGAGRNSIKEFLHFLGVANGSCYELENQLIISNRLDYISNEEFEKMEAIIFEIQKMIFSLKKSLKAKV